MYFKTIKAHIASTIQYKGWPMMMIHVLALVIADPIGLVLLFMKFGDIGTWSMEKILLIYAMAIAGFGLAEAFFRGYDKFPWRMIRSGDFDRLLLRPRSLFAQVAYSFFDLHRFSRVFGGVAVMFWCLHRLGIPITPFRLLIIAQALAGGMTIYAGVFVMTSGIAFFTVQALDWIYIFTNVSYQITRCPVDYIPRFLKNAFTFIIPTLVISYYPASVICGWGDETWKGLMALPAGFMFLGLAVVVWRLGVRHYTSTGS